jgi:hypothetical protein
MSKKPVKKLSEWTTHELENAKATLENGKHNKDDLIRFAEREFGVKLQGLKAEVVEALVDHIRQQQDEEDTVDGNGRGGVSFKFAALLVLLAAVPLVLYHHGYVHKALVGQTNLDLISCVPTTTPTNSLVRQMVSAARHARAPTGPPQSLVLYSTSAAQAWEMLQRFARKRFPVEACWSDRVISNGHTLTDESLRNQLLNHPDSLILVDWTRDMSNFHVMKRVLDSRCALERCDKVVRDASLFIIVTSMSESQLRTEFKGGIDIIARTTIKLESLLE